MQESNEIDVLREEIQLLKDEKVRLDKMKSRLFSIVSHDIKSPLGILVGFADVLMRHVDDTYDTKDDQQLAQIKGYLNDGKNKILTLLENLVNWVKIENGSVPYRATEIKIIKTLEALKTELEPNATKKEITVEVSGDEDLTCFGDATTFNVIIKNLLDNSIKYSEAGGIISLSATEENDSAIIEIKDSGTGIPSDNMDQIFEANKERVKPGTNGEQGIGLGLPVVKGFVSLNNGEIKVESEEGKGTSITLTFPSKAPKETNS
ncbi:sensor histidine kinase [Ekhidna sp.]|uniref:sensor histidine kinase n=1 Tax=Ekhidna sp. TaxID=2608089 RepID=UPI003B506EFF